MKDLTIFTFVIGLIISVSWSAGAKPCRTNRCDSATVVGIFKQLGIYKEADFSKMVPGQRITSLIFSCKSDTLPEAIGDLSELQYLTITNGNIKKIPASIGNLKKLELLDLSNNQIESLPGSICQIRTLKYLILNNNRLQTLPDSIVHMNSFLPRENGNGREVYLDFNYISPESEAIRTWLDQTVPGWDKSQYIRSRQKVVRRKRNVADKMFFTGATMSYNVRNRIVSLSNSEFYTQSRNDARIYGLTLGKRLPFLLHTRLHLPLHIEYGSVVEDTLEDIPLEDGSRERLLLSTTLLHTGFIPELQIPIRFTQDAALYLGAGGGIHFVKFTENEYIDGREDIRVIDSYLEEGSGLSFSAGVGVGFEVIIRDHFGISLNYSFHYWNPIRSKTSRDLFPYQALSYKENYHTHLIQLLLLIKR